MAIEKIIGGVILLVLTIIFAIIAYFIKRYIDKQDESIKGLKEQNEKLSIKLDEDTEELKKVLESRIATEYSQTNRALLKEKDQLMAKLAKRDAYIAERVERRVRKSDCVCQSEEVKQRFDTGDQLFGDIKKCLETLQVSVSDGLEGIHQYSLIMSSTMLALCKNFGDGVNCDELEALHTALTQRRIEHIVEKVDQ